MPKKIKFNFYGFTLVETVIALAVISVVLLPAAVIMHRILDFDINISDKIKIEMISSEVIHNSEVTFYSGISEPTIKTFFSDDGLYRIFSDYKIASEIEPASVSVSLNKTGSIEKKTFSLSLFPCNEKAD